MADGAKAAVAPKEDGDLHKRVAALEALFEDLARAGEGGDVVLNRLASIEGALAIAGGAEVAKTLTRLERFFDRVADKDVAKLIRELGDAAPDGGLVAKLLDLVVKQHRMLFALVPIMNEAQIHMFRSEVGAHVKRFIALGKETQIVVDGLRPPATATPRNEVAA